MCLSELSLASMSKTCQPIQPTSPCPWITAEYQLVYGQFSKNVAASIKTHSNLSRQLSCCHRLYQVIENLLASFCLPEPVTRFIILHRNVTSRLMFSLQIVRSTVNQLVVCRTTQYLLSLELICSTLRHLAAPPPLPKCLSRKNFRVECTTRRRVVPRSILRKWMDLAFLH